MSQTSILFNLFPDYQLYKVKTNNSFGLLYSHVRLSKPKSSNVHLRYPQHGAVSLMYRK